MATAAESASSNWDYTTDNALDDIRRALDEMIHVILHRKDDNMTLLRNQRKTIQILQSLCLTADEILRKLNGMAGDAEVIDDENEEMTHEVRGDTVDDVPPENFQGFLDKTIRYYKENRYFLLRAVAENCKMMNEMPRILMTVQEMYDVLKKIEG